MIWNEEKNKMKIERNFFENLKFFDNNINENYVDLKQIKKWIKSRKNFFCKIKNSLIIKSTKTEN